MPLLVAMTAMVATMAMFFVYLSERQASGVATQTENEQLVDALDAASVEIASLQSELLQSRNELETAIAEQDAAAAQIQELSTELASRPEQTAYSPVESGTVAFLFGTRLAVAETGEEQTVQSFAFTRSAVPLEGVRINSDTIVPAYSSYPTVGQSQSIRWKRRSLVGYLNPETELLVLQVIEVGDAYWIEACLVSGQDCGN